MEEMAVLVCDIAHRLQFTVRCSNSLEVLVNKYESNIDAEG